MDKKRFQQLAGLLKEGKGQLNESGLPDEMFEPMGSFDFRDEHEKDVTKLLSLINQLEKHWYDMNYMDSGQGRNDEVLFKYIQEQVYTADENLLQWLKEIAHQAEMDT